MKHTYIKGYTTIGFLIPGLALIAVFIMIPILLTTWVSMHSWSMFASFNEMEFVGLNNFKQIFAETAFKQALLNTVLFSVSSMALMVPLSIIIGIFLYSAAVKGIGFVRTALFIPYMIPPVAVAIVWGYLYSPIYGPLNEILSWLHLPQQEWLGSTDTSMLSIIILNAWQTLGYYTIIILAGLTEIPKDLYESASIDGASWFKKIVYVTIPLLKRSIIFIMIIMTINTLQVFDPVYILTQGGPVNSTNIVSYHMYEAAFNFGHAGLASAMAFILFVMVLTLTTIQLRLFKSL